MQRTAAATGLLFAAIMLGCAARASTDTAGKPSLVVREAQPEKVIRHEVEWRGPLRSERRVSMLEGPKLFSGPVSAEKNTSEPVRFSWYKIEGTDEFPATTVCVTMAGGSEVEFVVDAAAYLLSMTQTLDVGTPADIPAWLSQYVAYRILTPLDREGKLPAAPVTADPNIHLKSPALLCLPVEQWHHHDSFPVKSSESCWIAYSVAPREGEVESLSTLDQFGLNSLQLTAVKWLCVPGEFRLVGRD